MNRTEKVSGKGGVWFDRSRVSSDSRGREWRVPTDQTRLLYPFLVPEKAPYTVPSVTFVRGCRCRAGREPVAFAQGIKRRAPARMIAGFCPVR